MNYILSTINRKKVKWLYPFKRRH